MKPAAIRLALYPAIAYVTIGAFFYFQQGKLLFPAPKTYEKRTPADIGLRFDDLRLLVNAADHVHAWWIPAATPSDKVVLVFHGNGYVLEDMVEEEAGSLHETGANLLLVDYRGYGSSTPVSPNEATVDEDAIASLDYLLRDRKIPVGNVFVLGRSIGSGPATYLATRNQGLAGLILESPFSSIDDAAAGFWYFRIFPALILRTHFDNQAKIGSVRAPLLIVSGTADTLTPTWMADKLFARAHQPKQLYLVPGAGHNDLLSVGGSNLLKELRKFVIRLKQRNNRYMLMRIASAVILLAAFAMPCSMSFVKVSYQKHRRSDTPLFRFEKNGHAGFVNAEGKVVIAPKFDIGWSSEEDFVEGLSAARAGENWGFIDVRGNWVIEPKYWRVEDFSEGLAAVTYPFQKYDLAAAYIDKNGKGVIEFVEGIAEAQPFSEGLAAVRRFGRAHVGNIGYINRSGAFVIPEQFAEAGQFHEGLAAVVFDGECYIEARNGLPRMTPPSVPSATSCGGVPEDITKKCGEGFIDKTGKVVYRFEEARGFSEGLAAVESDGKWGFVDTKGQFRVLPQFEAAESYREGLAAAKFGGKWGYVDRAGQWVIEPQFAKADEFSDHVALTDAGYIDRDGRHVALANDGTPFVQGLAHVTLGKNEYGYINHTGKVVFRYHPDAVKPSMLPYGK